MDGFWQHLNELLGLNKDAQELAFRQVALRAVIVFFSVLLMLRVAEKRFLARRNALDTLLGFLLASMLARAINGSERLFQSIGAGLLLVLLHRGLAWGCCASHRFGKWLKGEPELLIDQGTLQSGTLDRVHMSEHDLKEDLRLKTGSDDISRIERAQLERNGEISVRQKPK